MYVCYFVINILDQVYYPEEVVVVHHINGFGVTKCQSIHDEGETQGNSLLVHGRMEIRHPGFLRKEGQMLFAQLW